MENKQAKKLSKRQALREERARQAKRQRILIISVILIFVAVIIALIVFSNSNVTTAVGVITPITPEAYQNENGVKIGNSNAKVVIDVFEDFQCSACQSYTVNIEPRVISELAETGMVLYVSHSFPFEDDNSPVKDSDTAANGAMCAAEQNRMMDFKRLTYANLQYIVGEFSEKRMDEFANWLGLDTNQFSQCMSERRYQKDIDADLALGKQMGVAGTPSVFVNGVDIKPGYVPSFDEIKAAVEAALAALN
jgi:protein-disulfide isomerase